MQRLRSGIAALGMSAVFFLAPGCERECVDVYDCTGKSKADHKDYTCVDFKCVEGSPFPDAGTATGGGSGGGGGGGGEVVSDAGSTAWLALNTQGGTTGLGGWSALDPSSLSKLATLAEPRGLPANPGSGGFTWNPVDHHFYAVLSESGTWEYLARGDSFTPPGDLVRFDPVTDTLEYVATIPLLDPAGTGRTLAWFNTSPIISPDGKSLMLIAQRGGGFHKAPTGESPTDVMQEAGALVHVDIDPASAHFKRFTPVYGFHEYGLNLPWNQQMRKVAGKPLLVKVNGAPALFVITDAELVRPPGSSLQITHSKLVRMQPTVATDWSKPWAILGTPMIQGGEGVALQAQWTEADDTYYWSASAEAFDRALYANHNVGLGPTTRTAWIGSQDMIVRKPVSTFKIPGRRFTYVLASNDGTTPVRIIETEPNDGLATSVATVRRTFDDYVHSDGEGLAPAGVALSESSGRLFLTATSEPGIQRLFDNVGRGLWESARSLVDGGLPTQAAYMSQPLEQLYLGNPGGLRGPSPGRLEELDTSNFSGQPLVRGSLAQGWVFVGAPALGGLASDLMADRFVVTLAVAGGAAGGGAVLKYDRSTGQLTSTPFGARTVAAPTGRPLQLASGVVIGGANERANAGLDPRKAEPAIWVMDPHRTPATVTEFALPNLDVPLVGLGLRLAKAEWPPLGFTRAADGSLWALAPYLVWDFHPVDVATLLRLDPQTGRPTGEAHAWGVGMAFRSEMRPPAGRGNVLCFVNPLYLSLLSTDYGHEVRCADVSDRDAQGKPQSSTVAFVPAPELLADGGVPTGVDGPWEPAFGPTLEPASNELYLMTTATGRKSAPVTSVQIHQLVPGSPITTGVTVTAVATAPGTDLPGTELFAASDGRLYYGTRGAKLMKFDPVAKTITQVADLSTATAGFTSDCRGYLSEGEGGVLIGIVADRDTFGARTARRAWKFDLATKAVSSVDVTGEVSDRDHFPGLVPIKR